MIKPVLTAVSPRFSAKSEPAETIPQRFYRKSSGTHHELHEGAQFETVTPKTMGERMRKTFTMLLMGVASIASGYGGFQTYTNYKSHVPTPEQVATDNQMKGYQERITRPSEELINWEPGNAQEAGKPAGLVSHGKQAELKQVQTRFYRAFISLLSCSDNPADQALAVKMREGGEQLDLQTAKLATDLTTYLQTQSKAGTPLELGKFLADQPQLSKLDAREREYLAAHITMEYTENPNSATAIQELLNNAILSKMAGFSADEIQKIDNPAQLATFFEAATKNNAFFPQLTGQERERLATQGKVFLSSLSHQETVPPAQWLMGLGLGLMTLGGGLGLATAWKTNNSIKKKLEKRKLDLEFMKNNGSAVKILLQNETVPGIQALERKRDEGLSTLQGLRDRAVKGDSEVAAFFASFYGYERDPYNRRNYTNKAAMPSGENLKHLYHNKAQQYFLTQEKRKVVPYEDVIAKVVEMIEGDLKKHEYLPELAFADPDRDTRRALADDAKTDFTQESFNRMMAEVDADVMDNIQMEMNHRIFMQATKDKLQALIAKNKDALPAALPQDRRAAQTERQEKDWKSLHEQTMGRLQEFLDSILNARIGMEENRLNWQMTWLQHNQNSDYSQIVEDLNSAARRTQGMAEGSDESLKNLQLNVAVTTRALEKRRAELAQRQTELKESLEKARSGLKD